MVRVFFESKGYAELAAQFETESEYMEALPKLEAEATKCRMILTESIT